MPVPDLLRTLRQNQSDHTALTLVQGQQVVLLWSFHELHEQVESLQQDLQSFGVRAGDRLCLLAHNSPHFLALFLACLALPCCFVPLHPDQASQTLAATLCTLRPRLVVLEEGLPFALQQNILAQGCRVLRLRISQQPWLRAILVRRRHVSRAGFNDVCRLRSTGAEPERNPGAAGDDVDPRPVLLLHSSGSTGQPKVIQYTRGSLNTFLCWQGLLFRAFADRYANDQEALLSPRIVSLPLAHFGGLSFCLQALLEGRTVHLLRQHSPHDCLALALRSRCQLLLLVPTLYELLLEVAGHSATASSLRYCLTMGEPLAPQLGARIRHALGAEVFSAYGMSEGLSGIGHAADGQQAPPGSCGRLLFGSAKLLDAEGRESAEQGELWVRNATTRPCYLDAQMNARNFREGWYRTGDRFMRDTQGWYYYLGRVDAMCFVNGRNVYPRDVEAVLLQHPLVADCIAAPLVLHSGRQRPAVLVRTKAGTSVTAQELMDHCLAFGALHVAPAWLTFCRQLPLTATGKHDRQSAARLLEQDYRQQQRLAC